jgi:hypothetical protein
MAGIATEILANPSWKGPGLQPRPLDLKFEEFFLGSWAVGDPAMLVDRPASGQKSAIGQALRGSRDEGLLSRCPSNVSHTGGSREMRIYNAGECAARPPLHAPMAPLANSDKASYLDSQLMSRAHVLTRDYPQQGGNRSQTARLDFPLPFFMPFAQACGRSGRSMMSLKKARR